MGDIPWDISPLNADNKPSSSSYKQQPKSANEHLSGSKMHNDRRHIPSDNQEKKLNFSSNNERYVKQLSNRQSPTVEQSLLTSRSSLSTWNNSEKDRSRGEKRDRSEERRSDRRFEKDQGRYRDEYKDRSYGRKDRINTMGYSGIKGHQHRGDRRSELEDNSRFLTERRGRNTLQMKEEIRETRDHHDCPQPISHSKHNGEVIFDSRKSYPADTITSELNDDDDIIFVGKPRKRHSKPSAVVNTLNNDQVRRIKSETIKTELDETLHVSGTPILVASITPTTSVSRLPALNSSIKSVPSMPITTTSSLFGTFNPPIQSLLNVIANPVIPRPVVETPVLQYEMPMSTTSPPSEIRLVGMPLKIEPKDVQDAAIDESPESAIEQDTRIYPITATCTTCQLRIKHMCDKTPSPEDGAQTLRPGDLLSCKCNFLFLHNSNCGGNKKKESFAPEAKQQGHLKQVDRNHDYECHVCNFRFSLGAIKKDFFFTKLNKTEINVGDHKCLLIKKCDEISRTKYNLDVRTYQYFPNTSALFRSQEEFVNIRRGFIDRCNDGCCKIFHECWVKTDENEINGDNNEQN